jgi:transcriptional regulator with XRE-family HTH domain
MNNTFTMLVDWRTYVVAVLVFGFTCGFVLRLVVHLYPKDDPRRKELIAELYAVAFWERPVWVAQQLETALFEGVRERLASRYKKRQHGTIGELSPIIGVSTDIQRQRLDRPIGAGSKAVLGGEVPPLRRLLGAELRRLREDLRMTMDEVAEKLELPASTVARSETGYANAHPRDVDAMLHMYGLIDERKREALLTLARRSRERGWWYLYRSVLPSDMVSYISVEDGASSIRSFQTMLIPDLLQTAEYSKAITGTFLRDEPPDIIEQLLMVRQRRQELLAGPDPVPVHIVLDETVLRRKVGGPKVMRGQLEWLLHLAAGGGVTLQVLREEGAHIGLGGPFTLFGLLEPVYGLTLVHIENQRNFFLAPNENDIWYYLMVFRRLQERALPVKDSLALLRDIAWALA